MGLIDKLMKWLLGSPEQINDPVQSFLNGETDSLSSRDLEGAAALLETSCNPPSIYKGHYQELFKIWRKVNRESLKDKNYEQVIKRANKMIEYDQQMISKMSTHWAAVQGRKLPLDYFDKDRNLKITDAKALLKAADATNDPDLADRAQALIDKFNSDKEKK